MDFGAARARMVRDQLLLRGIHDRRVLTVMGTVPREKFVPQDYQSEAYDDGPLPIGEGQTISQPFVVAMMTEALRLTGDERVLEVGTGSGYQTAILAGLAREVWSVEIHPALSARAGLVFAELGLGNVHTRVGDGSQGWPEHAPYDAIIVTAAPPVMPEPLQEQLAPTGRIVLPIGGLGDQELECWQRRGGAWHIDRLSAVRFVPLVGMWGWRRKGEGEG